MLSEQCVYGCEPGTFALPVMNVDRTCNVLGLVLVDSGDYARSGGYGSPSVAALRFLADVPHALVEQSQAIAAPRETPDSQETLPCMVFQHFAIPQYYDLLKPVAANAARAIEGYRNFAGNHYVLDESKTQPGSYLGEGISCPDADSGEYAMLCDNGYFAIPQVMTIAMVSSARSRFPALRPLNRPLVNARPKARRLQELMA